MNTTSAANAYSKLIRLGRMLKDHSHANKIVDDAPEVILSIVNTIEVWLRFTPVDDFFSIFPPLKRYDDDGTWDYQSTLKMRQDLLGTHFGKDDFKHLIMSSCYENKWLRLVGVSYMWSISRIYKRENGKDMLLDFLNQKK